MTETPTLIKPQRTSFDTTFTVMPKDCNYLGDMLFGGALLAHMDIVAAMAVRRALYETKIRTALTVGVNNVKFLIGATIGDILLLKANVAKVGLKSLTVYVEGHRERKGDGKVEKVCEGDFVFVAVDENRKATRHYLTLED